MHQSAACPNAGNPASRLSAGMESRKEIAESRSPCDAVKFAILKSTSVSSGLVRSCWRRICDASASRCSCSRFSASRSRFWRKDIASPDVPTDVSSISDGTCSLRVFLSAVLLERSAACLPVGFVVGEAEDEEGESFVVEEPPQPMVITAKRHMKMNCQMVLPPAMVNLLSLFLGSFACLHSNLPFRMLRPEDNGLAAGADANRYWQL